MEKALYTAWRLRFSENQRGYHIATQRQTLATEIRHISSNNSIFYKSLARSHVTIFKSFSLLNELILPQSIFFNIQLISIIRYVYLIFSVTKLQHIAQNGNSLLPWIPLLFSDERLPTSWLRIAVISWAMTCLVYTSNWPINREIVSASCQFSQPYGLSACQCSYCFTKKMAGPDSLNTASRNSQFKTGWAAVF